MMKIRTLLYFGSFNPVHIGHTAIANYAVAEGLADELWFVVSPQNPFKPSDSLADAAHRLEMVRVAIGQSGLAGRISATDVELHLPTPSYTIQTLDALWKACPEREFGLLMGSDNLAGVRQWKEAERILKHCPVYVYDRPGCSDAEIPQGYNIKRISNVPLLEIGATRLRHWLAEGKYIPALFPHGVYDYIEEHGLYRIDNKH